ncbi:sigma-54 factor interaction domain-containing protein [Nitrosococcus halophilus Nc 4]|uniref:Sigma-54 factor interaction domain-containing protein n=1 Tax=Nitrosococcus halophilus (strain Nc4) TaxID=472759 RepID=D5C1M9_NITHN|nr:sigma 54-interacting transcriptional regulator [Nitrosococcus halophilus]ADE14662.1 sigma-54 factor interaction domain-containing protein [Nitrosococcus halophilus Nc 4]
MKPLLNPEISQAEVTKLADLCCSSVAMQWIALVPATFPQNKTLNEFISGCFFDYHTLPLDMPRLQITLGHALGMAKLACLAEKPPMVEPFLDHLLVGKNPQMCKLNHDIQKIAAVNAPVLIRGESGTGKELVARAIHHYSQRQGPFEAVNCAALPPSLIQSELFGHEKGAFTGAARRKIGRIEAASGGTIFLLVLFLPYL